MSTGSRKTRKKKSGTEMENVVEEDMFYSKLSEPHLISHILSFLPTRDAVRTSVLSKKWLHNWTFITKLDFDDGLYHDSYGNRFCTHCKSRSYNNFYVSNKVGSDDLTLCGSCSNSEDALYNGGNSLSFSDLMKVKVGESEVHKERFVKFAYNALLFTKNNNSSISSMLERFSLVINNKHYVGHLNIWISCILNRRVKNLKIHSSVHNLPFYASTSKSLLNSTQLEELELVLNMFTTINVPSDSVHFGNLKYLKLSGIDFTIDSSCDYLTLRLPVLKKFEIINCKWPSGKDVIVDASLLENISIQQGLNELHGKSIKFNALYLKEFNYCGYGGLQQINLSGCSFMPYASVKIILKRCKNISKKRCFYFQIFQHFNQVKCIKFEGLQFLKQSKEDVYPVSALPVFANLSHMELGVVTIEVIFGLLQNSPVLKTLVLALKETPNFAKELVNFAVVPDCLTSALQIVNFEKVKGNEQELFLAEFLLKNGKMLERMSFSLGIPTLAKSKVMKEFKEKLYSFMKGHSCSSYLEFSYGSVTEGSGTCPQSSDGSSEDSSSSSDGSSEDSSSSNGGSSEDSSSDDYSSDDD